MLPYFKYLPQTTLAAVVLFAVYGLLEFEDLIYFYHLRAWVDMAIAVACFLVTVLAGVEVCARMMPSRSCHPALAYRRR